MDAIKLGTLVVVLFLTVLMSNGMLFAADEASTKTDAPSSGTSAEGAGVQERAVPMPFGRPGMVAPPPRTFAPIPFICNNGVCTCDGPDPAYDCGAMGGAHVCVPGTFKPTSEGGTCTERKS